MRNLIIFGTALFTLVAGSLAHITHLNHGPHAVAVIRTGHAHPLSTRDNNCSPSRIPTIDPFTAKASLSAPESLNLATQETSASSLVNDAEVQQCNFSYPQEHCPSCGSYSTCACENTSGHYSPSPDGMPQKYMLGVDRYSNTRLGGEATWRDAQMVPFESFAYGGYIGPHRTPHVQEYQLRVNDQLNFVYHLTRSQTGRPYELFVGDSISINSGGEPNLNQQNVLVLTDGSISLPLIGRVIAAGKTVDRLAEELNERYSDGMVQEPAITIQVTKSDTPLQDIRDAVDARQGQGGQSQQVTVSPDGTIQLPVIGAVPAIGLTLDEIAAEVNARYQMKVHGLAVTPIIVQRAPRAVFVLGQVNRSGRIELNGPTTVMQVLAQAESWQVGANLRQVIIFRRDQNWQLVATKLDLAGALHGKKPHPADEIWLQDSDIVLVPKQPILRFSEGVDLYLRRSVYSIFPQQQLVFNFDDFLTF